MRRMVEAAQGHKILTVAVVWFGVMALAAVTGAGSVGDWQVVAIGFIFICGATMHARSGIRMVVNGVVGGVVGLALAMLVLVLQAFVTGDAGAEGETPFSLLIESPLWIAIFSPLGAFVGFLGAAARYWLELIFRDRAARHS